MLVENKINPVLRFKDDGGCDYPDWEEKSFNSVINYTKGFAFKSNEYRDSGYRVVRVSDLGENYIKKDNVNFPPGSGVHLRTRHWNPCLSRLCDLA